MTKDFLAYRKELQGLIGTFRKQAPETMAGFGKLHESAMKAGSLDMATKELIALGIGISTRCDGCLAFHTHEALANGATREQIVETIGVAVMMGGGPSLMYAAHAMDALEQFEAAGAGK
ncbi:MAG TPA: carboxymuconolactone decarboxylase family protein [Capsulimonadaceae bacterium]|jgi:AhpD family alkylhydroperoxidase